MAGRVCSNHGDFDVLVEAVGVRHLGMSDVNESDDHVQQTTNISTTRLRATFVLDAVTIKMATHSSSVEVDSFVFEACVPKTSQIVLLFAPKLRLRSSLEGEMVERLAMTYSSGVVMHSRHGHGEVESSNPCDERRRCFGHGLGVQSVRQSYFMLLNISMMTPAAGTPSLSKVSRSSTSGNTQSIYEDDEDGVVLTLEALISFPLAELAFDTRSWFDTRYLTRETLRCTDGFTLRFLGM